MTLLLSGCNLVSSRVYEIGRRQIALNAEIQDHAIQPKLGFFHGVAKYDPDMYFDIWIYLEHWREDRTITPVTFSLIPKDGANLHDSIRIDVFAIDEKGNTYQFTDLQPSEGAPGKRFLYGHREYRRWYGYPAQALLVVSIPVDVVIDLGVGIGYLCSRPFVSAQK